MNYDPEVPAGYQDADLEQAAFEEQSRHAADLRRRGICTHGWTQGIADNGDWYGDGERPAPGMALCLHCGEHVPAPSFRR